MFRLTRFLIIFLGLGWLVVPSSAQGQHAGNWQYKLEFFGNVGHGSFRHGDSKMGAGHDYGGGVGIRPFSGRLRGLGFELQLADLTTEWVRHGGAWAQHLNSRLVAGNGLYHFANRTRVQPYLFVGFGSVNVNHSFHCEICVYDVDPVTGELVPTVQDWGVQASKTGITLGGGLKMAVHRHLWIRPELFLMDTSPGSGPNWNWFRVQIGLSIHF